jgi:transposase-like protein
MIAMKSKVQNRSTKGDTVAREALQACADEHKAVEFVEKQRWGDLPACPECGDTDVYRMLDRKTGERNKDFRWRCRGCGKLYTVRYGTVFEDSRVPMRHWVYAFLRANSSKKGVSALEIHRQTGVSYKSALFMLHRIRFGMSDSEPGRLTGHVEVDEVYIGGKPRYEGQSRRGRGTRKQAVVALVERGGRVRTKPVADVTAKTLKKAIQDSVDVGARIITDENPSYNGLDADYAAHETVCHSLKEYVRGDVHSNTVESYFALVKRGLNGVYHSVSRRHLHRYLDEFEFRYNNRGLEDGERVTAAILASEGKRLVYRCPVM